MYWKWRAGRSIMSRERERWEEWSNLPPSLMIVLAWFQELVHISFKKCLLDLGALIIQEAMINFLRSMVKYKLSGQSCLQISNMERLTAIGSNFLRYKEDLEMEYNPPELICLKGIRMTINYRKWTPGTAGKVRLRTKGISIWYQRHRQNVSLLYVRVLISSPPLIVTFAKTSGDLRLRFLLSRIFVMKSQ